jgi:hypothetical protein
MSVMGLLLTLSQRPTIPNMDGKFDNPVCGKLLRAGCGELGCEDHLQHLRVRGQHGLDQKRFDAIVDWTASEAICQKSQQ